MLIGIFKRKWSTDKDGTVSQNASDNAPVDAAMELGSGCASSMSSLARLLDNQCFPCDLSTPSTSTDTRPIDIADLDL